MPHADDCMEVDTPFKNQQLHLLYLYEEEILQVPDWT